MEPFIQSGLVEVRHVQDRGRGGRGVFARRAIAAGKVIERAPVILIPRSQVFDASNVARPDCLIAWYVFEWDDIDGRPYVAMPQGYGALYNHSYNPNADYELEMPDMLQFVALRRIAKGEEITVNYNGFPDSSEPVGFSVKQ